MPAPTLRLFVDRKVIQPDCMRGYLLTQLDAEPKPNVACYVLERTPDNNAPFSAIPAGTYPVHVRTDGARGWRLELEDVPNRTKVQVHIGNYPTNTQGCLLPGLGALPNDCSVQNSAGAMKQLKALFAIFGQEGETTITITDP